jgi:hypothetical protein
MGHAFVTESGSTYATGPATNGKRIVEFDINADGSAVTSGPDTLVEYTGTGKATAVGLAAGEDGLYFTDLYKDQGYQSPIDRGANLLRVYYCGASKRSRCVLRGPRGVLRAPGRSGPNRRRYAGRLKRRALPAGHYFATIRARDAAGNVSKPRRAHFRVAPRRQLRKHHRRASARSKIRRR